MSATLAGGRVLLLLAAGCLLLALGLASWASGLDLTLHHALALHAGAFARKVTVFTALGGLTVMGPLAIVALLWLIVRRRGADALWLAATIVSGRLVVEGVKLLVLRPRPPVVDRLELVTSWSFPSSHSAGTMMTCLALALLFGRGPAALVVAFLAALAIGWSRVALAVHWPGDVLAGWGFGLIWIALALLVQRRLAGKADPLRPLPPE